MTMIKKHHTPKYILNRIRLFLYEKANPGQPWLTKDSIKLLNHLILPTDIGCEFGSGSSTFWLSKRCKHLTSIEHDYNWYSKVLSWTEKQNNIKLLYRGVTNGKEEHSSPYIEALNELEPSSLDFLLIDGKNRDLISLNSISKIKDGGLIVLDNAERYLPNKYDIPSSIGQKYQNSHWEEFDLKTSVFRRIWTTNGITSTLIIFKR